MLRAMSHRPTGQAPSRLVAVLGPTNTGKTHLAVERMLGHASGMIGLPLRLLAREIYDRVVKARGPRAVALITGEEKIIPPRAHYFVCTVEAMPLGRQVEFLAVDEVQLVADPERGHVFTDRLLHARGTYETMFLGAATLAPLIRRLLPSVEIVERERFSTLSWSGARKITRLPRRSAVVAFSADQVYAIAELIRRQRGGAAVVMGSLSPRTRNAQVALYQSGEVDFLVATDAIGMGLNMDVDHVAFAGLSKFDGRRHRRLHPGEVGQIAGRAGRFRTDGTFGVTGGCELMDEDLIGAVENHRFDPVENAYWRNSALDFQSLSALLRSLSAPASREGLRASEEALDERALRALAAQHPVADRCADRSVLFRLWDACQTPDFRKITPDEHIGLVRMLFDHLSTGDRRVPEDWITDQYRRLDRLDGEIDALSTRLAGVRTLAYVAHRPDWLVDPGHWRERSANLETRLSDALHEKLMARFIDRRTSVLLRGLGAGSELLAGVGENGVVTVEGHYIGRLKGVRFESAQGAGALEAKALRGAAARAVAPEVARRLGKLASEGDEAFSLDTRGDLLWRGEAVGTLTNDDPFRPRVRLFGDLGPAPARERAALRLEAFVASQASSGLKGQKALTDALASGRLRGLARGLAYRLVEGGGVLNRRGVERELRELSQGERRALRTLGVRFGGFCLFLPEIIDERPLALACADRAAPGWRWTREGPQLLPAAPPPERALGLRGLMRAGNLAIPVATLERLSSLLRPAGKTGGLVLTQESLDGLGWTTTRLAEVMRGLEFVPAGKTPKDGAVIWRRRRESSGIPSQPASLHSPFAVLAEISAQAPPTVRPRRRRSRRPSPKAARA
jgi:ATP-dependent RNA helicase SUPV3L1/SUV3